MLDEAGSGYFPDSSPPDIKEHEEVFPSEADEVMVLLSDDTQETQASTRNRLRTKARSTHCPGLP